MAGSSRDERAEFLRLLDEGLSVVPAATRVGVPLRRGYAWAREVGRVAKRTTVTVELEQRVLAAFAGSGTLTGAAVGSGLSCRAARRVLVRAGLLPAEPRPMKKGPEWVRGGAAGHAEARAALRYTRGMSRTMPQGARLLSLQDRLLIADGLQVGWSVRRIAQALGRQPSTISREIENYATAGVYLPHLADQAAAEARARPKPSKLATHPRLRAEVRSSWGGSCRRSRSLTGSGWTFQTTRACG